MQSEMIVRAALCLVLAGLSGSRASPVAGSYDTIVVGLGSAGTTAATTLARAGRRVLALEAQDRVGGRVWTRPFGDGVVELGGEWIHGLHPSRVYDLALQNDVSVLLQEMSATVYRSDTGRKDAALTDLLNYCAEVMEEGSDLKESVGDLVERKLRQRLQEQPGVLTTEEEITSFMDLLDRMSNSVDASSSFREVSASGPYEALNGSLYGSWHRHGYRTFFDILLNTYNDGPGLPTLDMKLNKEVTSIQWPRDPAGDVVVTCSDGDQYSSANVIVTVSLGVLKERHEKLFAPPLPEEKVSAINSISMGVLDKVVLLLEQPWSVDECVMFHWSAADVAALPPADRWLARFAGTSSPTGLSNALTLWVAGDDAKFVETLSEELLQQKVVELLQRFVGANVTVPRVVGMMRSKWFSNRFTRGSYSFDSMTAALHPELRDQLAAPLLDAGGTPRVLLAGEATEPKRYATVHGASDSGYREAQRLLATGTSAR